MAKYKDFFASPQPPPKERSFKKQRLKVLSFREDLGEAFEITALTQSFCK